MRTAFDVFGITAVLLLLGAAILLAQGQHAQTCGNGIVLRAGGSVIIDAYQLYTMAPPAPGAPLTPAKIEEYPTKITLGATLKDAVEVCFESAKATRCVPLGAIRK